MRKYPKRIKEYIEFSKEYKKVLGPKGSYKKGEIEIIDDSKLFLKAEKEAAKQMMTQGISKREALKRGSVGVREKNRWGVSVCEPVKLPPKGALGTFVRFIPWAELEGGIAGIAILPVLPDGRALLLINFRHSTRRWHLEIPRGTQDPGKSIARLIEEELGEECGAELIGKPKFLGYISPDSGILSSKVSLYLAKVKIVKKPTPYVTEAIRKRVFLTKSELMKAIKEGKYKDKEGIIYDFSDGFTLSAYVKALGLLPHFVAADTLGQIDLRGRVKPSFNKKD